MLAAIRPAGKPDGVWALPKGLIGAGESPESTARREVAEETGTEGEPIAKLGDVRYVYTWNGERIFKVVSFYLFRYSRGRLGAVPPEHAHEVAEVRWLPLEEDQEEGTGRRHCLGAAPTEGGTEWLTRS